MDEHKFRKSHSSKVLQKDKSSIKIIKEYIKMLNWKYIFSEIILKILEWRIERGRMCYKNQY